MQRTARFVCARCEGQAITLAALRSSMDAAALTNLWMKTLDVSSMRRLPCPSCLRPALQLPAGSHDAPLYIDACRPCQMLWLDHNEAEQLQKLYPPRRTSTLPGRSRAEPELSPEAKKAVALARVQAIQDTYDESPQPGTLTENVLGYGFDLPVVRHDRLVQQVPMTTSIVSVLAVIVTLWGTYDATFFQEYALLPAEPLRHGGSTWLTSFFLHADLWHLFGNAYFFWCFGPHVEDVLGSWHYAALLAAASFAGTLAHVAIDGHPHVPLVGASDAISAVMVLYALLFPRAKIRVPWSYGYYRPRWFSISIGWWMGLWLFGQLLGVFWQRAGLIGVSAAAHLGGAAVGALAYAWLRRAER
ncbi:MAG TPA: rhomboid family intramembrane serine protease [Polyangiales bacterium]|nr:rhomboid family intramembrane serine protease [Polyangiales bacterium]